MIVIFDSMYFISVTQIQDYTLAQNTKITILCVLSIIWAKPVLQARNCNFGILSQDMILNQVCTRVPVLYQANFQLKSSGSAANSPPYDRGP